MAKLSDAERAVFTDIYRIYEKFHDLTTMQGAFEAAGALAEFEKKHCSALAINLGTAIWDSLPDPVTREE